MTPMPNERDPSSPDGRPTGASLPPGADEPEPDWAEEIRARRRARGDRLREVFATFDEEPERPGPGAEEPRP